MIVNLRGASGSGKSYVGHRFLEEFPHEEIFEDGWNKCSPRLIGYRLPGNLVVLGSYRARGGGLDTLSPHDRSRLVGLVDRYMRQGHVFFEALVISSTVPRYIELAEQLPAGEFVFAFLDTPVDLCIQRIYQRNGGRPIKESPVRGHHTYMRRVAERLREAGQTVVTVDNTRSYEEIKALLRRGGWAP